MERHLKIQNRLIRTLTMNKYPPTSSMKSYAMLPENLINIYIPTHRAIILKEKSIKSPLCKTPTSPGSKVVTAAPLQEAYIHIRETLST